jgi:hypothetical protein
MTKYVDCKEHVECKGCHLGTISFCITGSSYVNIKTNKTYHCPCINCIVKSICSKSCYNLRSYRSKLYINDNYQRRKAKYLRTLLKECGITI